MITMMQRFIPVVLASITGITFTDSQAISQSKVTCQRSITQSFLVFGGGGAPSYNEIALEKNMLYFQRSLKELGFSSSEAPIYFANGNTKSAFINKSLREGKG